jgi:glc operon protein GlcG
MLTLAKSRKIIDGAVQRAEQLNAKISVAVCGRDGGLIAFSRMDGCAGWDVDRSSLGVATAAAIIGGPSDQLSDRCTNGVRILSYANVVPPRGLRGGLPIVEEGVIEGGCGVSGAATAEESEECTRAGIAALNAARTEPPIGTYPQVKGATWNILEFSLSGVRNSALRKICLSFWVESRLHRRRSWAGVGELRSMRHCACAWPSRRTQRSPN